MPAALTLWFIWKARGNGLFLLGIPVLMVMGGSVFFENMKPFRVPGRFEPATLLMIWLAVVWVVTVARRRLHEAPVGPFGAGHVLPEELPLIGVAVCVGVGTLAAFTASGDLANAANLASGALYLVLGYLLLRGIASRATRAETQEFLAAVVIVNTLACALFILDQGLHVPIYRGRRTSPTRLPDRTSRGRPRSRRCSACSPSASSSATALDTPVARGAGDHPARRPRVSHTDPAHRRACRPHHRDLRSRALAARFQPGHATYRSRHPGRGRRWFSGSAGLRRPIGAFCSSVSESSCRTRGPPRSRTGRSA